MKSYFIMFFLCLSLLCAGEAKKKNIRIVSLSPNLTETVFALGCGKNLAGRSNVCNYPAAVRKIAIAGSFGRPNIERVLALKPDYIISAAMQDKAMIERFEQFKIKVLFLPAKSFKDYFRNLEALGKILNCPARAADLCRQSRAKLEKLEKSVAKIPEGQKVKALFVIQDVPLYTIGKTSFITDMIRLAGGKSVTAGENKAYFKCSMEWVIRQQPDVIIIPAASAKQVKVLAMRPGWRDLTAVKKNRIFYKFDPDLLSRMGPRTLDGIKLLRKYFESVRKQEKQTK
jgi:iron complex transport system substrate-binding protein